MTNSIVIVIRWPFFIEKEEEYLKLNQFKNFQPKTKFQYEPKKAKHFERTAKSFLRNLDEQTKQTNKRWMDGWMGSSFSFGQMNGPENEISNSTSIPPDHLWLVLVGYFHPTGLLLLSQLFVSPLLLMFLFLYFNGPGHTPLARTLIFAISNINLVFAANVLKPECGGCVWLPVYHYKICCILSL